MDEKLRAVRRRRRKERRLLRRIWSLVPVAAVAIAWMLSAGVVRLMEVPREAHLRPEASPSQSRSDAQGGAQNPIRRRSLLSPEPRPELQATLSISILDHEVLGPPEENRPMRRVGPVLGPVLNPSDLQSDLLLPEAPEDAPDQIAPVPEPGAAILLGGGLIWLGATRLPTRRRKRVRRRR
jgi:hypothetical protein